MRGRVNAIKTFKGLVADLRSCKNVFKKFVIFTKRIKIDLLLGSIEICICYINIIFVSIEVFDVRIPSKDNQNIVLRRFAVSRDAGHVLYVTLL